MVHGILNIYKERGYTSHDVVAKLRAMTGQKKIGHTGTLDPDAQGVLLVCLGVATKVCDLLTDTDKAYRVGMLLGQETDTQDTTGTVIRTCGELPEPGAVEQALLGFVGEYGQVPPMYSALKVGGKKLYELARQGKTVERHPRRVRIYDLCVEQMELPHVTFAVSCSKGTYMRTLCHDAGEALGCGACMESLVRTRVGSFCVEESLRLSEVGELLEQGRLGEALTPVDALFAALPSFSTTESADRLLRNGNSLRDVDLQRRDISQDADLKKRNVPQDTDLQRHDTTREVDLQKRNALQDTDLQRHDTTREADLQKRDTLQDADLQRRDISREADLQRRNAPQELDQARMYDHLGQFAGIYQREKGGDWVPRKMFLT